VLLPEVQSETSEFHGPAGAHSGRREPSPEAAEQATAELVPATGGAVRLIAITDKTSETRPSGSWRRTPAVAITPNTSKRPLRLRRGEDRERASYEILSSVESSIPAGGADSGQSSASDGISAFIARVLDQLTLSAWLPAAFLTASAAILLQFRSAKSANLLKAVQDLAANPVQVLVIVIPVLVIATIVTQAFSFEAIRALEGYWSARGPWSLARTLMIRWHVHRKSSIIKRKFKVSGKTVHAALSEMIIGGVSPPVAKALEAALSGNQAEASLLKADEMEALVKTNWRPYCAPWRLARIDRLLIEESCYPETYRILPTKLGNLIRATEDKLHNAGDVQSFVMRRRDMVSPRVQMQHDQFRTRLEMYSTLVFVSWFLAIMAPVVLAGRVGPIAIAIMTAGFAAMAIASYLAALASAAGYCSTLKLMDTASEAASGS
jgi:hypothetical protein